jgi:hypothetical protein
LPALPPEGSQPPPTGQQFASRASKAIFACNIPPDASVTDAIRVAQREQFAKDVKAWGETIGFSISTINIEGGIRLIAKADTLEARNRLTAAGVWQSVTALIVDFRRIGQQIIVSIYAELPPGFEFFMLFPPDPTSPQIIEAEKNISKLLGAAEGTCRLI